MHKENIPLEILDLLKPETNRDLSLFINVPGDHYFCLTPKSQTKSSFFFAVNRQIEESTAKTLYEISRKPASRGNVDEYTTRVYLNDVKKHLEIWIGLVKEYSANNTLLDDPILRAYETEFENRYKFEDDNSEFEPFDLEKQLLIDEYLTWVNDKLTTYRNGNENEYVEDIQRDIANLKEDLTKESKAQTVRRLAKIWAKARKVSLDLLKELFIKVTSTVISKMITGGEGP